MRRKALSHSINREEITKVIFNGTRTPATEFTAPVLDGYNDSIPGSDVLKFDIQKAKELWAQAQSMKPYDASKPLEIATNSDGGNKEWIDAIANSFKNNLGLLAEIHSFAQFADLLDLRQSKSLPGLASSAWQGDYPSLYNFLGPVWETGAPANLEKFPTLTSTGYYMKDLHRRTLRRPTPNSTKRRKFCLRSCPGCPCGKPISQ
ncbi:ABC-type oligopeptide transport system substrate-binding subunit [Paenarthrobacter nicotinovorans]|uniref:ABC transporter substrate-binding protein n=1 Tax=Paenarthrobacter nicotinovorans TaxID=29320 RepID=UPI0027810ABB|nr:ABC transporter substrate-binding protein [Paenarthrobacter nicotinovorans]MDP9933834.1 ABC-type oligopeptide transport system substrate-binding subunit [Paenarthrobacter nicotinovorans]